MTWVEEQESEASSVVKEREIRGVDCTWKVDSVGPLLALDVASWWLE